MFHFTFWLFMIHFICHCQFKQLRIGTVCVPCSFLANLFSFVRSLFFFLFLHSPHFSISETGTVFVYSKNYFVTFRKSFLYCCTLLYNMTVLQHVGVYLNLFIYKYIIYNIKAIAVETGNDWIVGWLISLRFFLHLICWHALKWVKWYGCVCLKNILSFNSN